MTKRKTHTKSASITNVAVLNALITSNKKQFKLGASMDSATFCDLVGIPALSKRADSITVQKHNLTKLSVYATMNRLLALRGLAIKSKNYYSAFHIVTKAEVTKRVGAYKAKAKATHKYAVTLDTGFTAFKGKWTKLTPIELKQAAFDFRDNMFNQ